MQISCSLLRVKDPYWVIWISFFFFILSCTAGCWHAKTWQMMTGAESGNYNKDTDFVHLCCGLINREKHLFSLDKCYRFCSVKHFFSIILFLDKSLGLITSNVWSSYCLLWLTEVREVTHEGNFYLGILKAAS